MANFEQMFELQHCLISIEMKARSVLSLNNNLFFMIIIPLIILCTVHPHPSTLLWLPVTTNLQLPGFPISWIRWGLCCRGFLQRLPWFSPWVAVVLYKGCRGFLHFLGKQSQLLLCPTQVELGLSRQSGVRQYYISVIPRTGGTIITWHCWTVAHRLSTTSKFGNSV